MLKDKSLEDYVQDLNNVLTDSDAPLWKRTSPAPKQISRF